MENINVYEKKTLHIKILRSIFLNMMQAIQYFVEKGRCSCTRRVIKEFFRDC